MVPEEEGILSVRRPITAGGGWRALALVCEATAKHRARIGARGMNGMSDRTERTK